MNNLKDTLIKQSELYSQEIKILKIKNKLNPSIENRDKYHNLQGRLAAIQFVLERLKNAKAFFEDRRIEDRRKMHP